jgi:hypothetical protein
MAAKAGRRRGEGRLGSRRRAIAVGVVLSELLDELFQAWADEVIPKACPAEAPKAGSGAEARAGVVEGEMDVGAELGKRRSQRAIGGSPASSSTERWAAERTPRETAMGRARAPRHTVEKREEQGASRRAEGEEARRARREMDERLPWERERRSVQRKEKERVGKR